MMVELPIYKTTMMYLDIDVLHSKVLNVNICLEDERNIDFKLTAKIYSQLRDFPGYVKLIDSYKTDKFVEKREEYISLICSKVEEYLSASCIF